ncbi:unnamed protein product [Mytilus coruscus]|uniref:MULE transposase domain-containing protein n=1 Tax=Mytilus coruscus TaxID=42192 RepID=A0A6J8BRA6_MYTCO|nr:unnamed protein product [Mytilus coruscus]
MQHMYGLRAVINIPLQSYYPPLVSSNYLTEPYHSKIVGRNVNESEEAATKLADVDTSDLVIGSDQEGSMVKVILKNFPDTTHVLCTRHLKSILSEKMTNGVGIHRKDRIDIEQRIFGRNSISNADESTVFEEKCEEVEEFCKEKFPSLKGYFSTVSEANTQWKNI